MENVILKKEKGRVEPGKKSGQPIGIDKQKLGKN